MEFKSKMYKISNYKIYKFGRKKKQIYKKYKIKYIQSNKI